MVNLGITAPLMIVRQDEMAVKSIKAMKPTG